METGSRVASGYERPKCNLGAPFPWSHGGSAQGNWQIRMTNSTMRFVRSWITRGVTTPREPRLHCRCPTIGQGTDKPSVHHSTQTFCKAWGLSKDRRTRPAVLWVNRIDWRDVCDSSGGFKHSAGPSNPLQRGVALTRNTTFPFFRPVSTYRCASAISERSKVWSMTG